MPCHSRLYRTDLVNFTDKMLQPGERIDFSKYGVRKVVKEVKVPGRLYCDLVSRLEEKCAQHSLLEI